MIRSILLGVLVFTVFATSTATAGVQRTYSVGNSLTWDSKPANYGIIADATAGVTTTFGYHIRCGMPLNYIVANPTEVCVTPTGSGTYEPALSGNTWDAISIQPFPGPGSTLATDASAIATFTALAPTATPYIYAAWPSRPAAGTSFADIWDLPSSGLDGQSTILSRDYFEDLITRARAAQPSGTPQVRMIPIGEVFVAFEQAINGGSLPTFTSIRDLYRDDLHLANVGRFLASTTAISTIYGIDPRGLSVDGIADFNSDPASWPTDQTITPELKLQLQTMVWDVVSTNPYTGVPEPASLSVIAGALLDAPSPAAMRFLDVATKFQLHQPPAGARCGERCFARASTHGTRANRYSERDRPRDLHTLISERTRQASASSDRPTPDPSRSTVQDDRALHPPMSGAKPRERGDRSETIRPPPANGHFESTPGTGVIRYPCRVARGVSFKLSTDVGSRVRRGLGGSGSSSAGRQAFKLALGGVRFCPFAP